MHNIPKINSTNFESSKIVTIINKHYRHNDFHHYYKISEYGRGRIEGKILNKSGNVQDAKEIIVHETKACNFDFLKGLNETINKDLAKKAYSLIRQ